MRVERDAVNTFKGLVAAVYTTVTVLMQGYNKGAATRSLKGLPGCLSPHLSCQGGRDCCPSYHVC